MKVLAVVGAFMLAAMAEAGYVTERQYQREFTRFVQVHDKTYRTEEFFHRYEIFKANLDVIEMHNAKDNVSSTMGVNQFTDMTAEEFASKMTGFIDQNQPKNYGPALTLENPPSEFDWRTKGAVTGVKDQGACGSCWAFSATGAMEGAWFSKHGKLISLSEQHLMDCSRAYGNMSCNGGLMTSSFKYVLDNKGICSEEAYPYTAKDRTTCDAKTCENVVSIASYTDVPFNPSKPGDESALMAALQLAPVSIALQASSSVFRNYKEGVVDDPSCGTSLNHGVTLVGYGTDAKLGDYWIVKNSWGLSWGNKGYILLARNKNMCGMNQMSTYVTSN